LFGACSVLLTTIHDNHAHQEKLGPERCGSFLACGGDAVPCLLCICDGRGRITRRTGQNSSISHLSSSHHKSIRMRPTNSTGLPQQSDKIF
jgi:hypothetical protein